MNRYYSALLFVSLNVVAGSQAARLEPLSGYATVQTAIQTVPRKPANGSATLPGYLGVEFGTNARAQVVIQQVAADSPAQAAGLRVGDVLLQVGGNSLRSITEGRDSIQRAGAGARAALTLERQGKKLETQAVLVALSKPLKLAETRGILGVQVSSQDDGEGLRVTSVTRDQPAARAGLKPGDILLKANDTPLLTSSSLNDTLSACEVGDSVQITYRRGESETAVKMQLAESPTPESDLAFSPRRLWKKETFRLAVVCVEFGDVQHNTAVQLKDWERFFFSTNLCAGTTNATGQVTFGSVNDYYREVSCGKFHFEGEVFDWVRLSTNRADYSQGTVSRRSRAEFFNQALDRLLQRHGTNALKGFDGLAIIYAGERFASANRGTLFWPHRGSTTYKGKSWSYIICPEGGKRMANISVFCHEFGHILGLPDLYARPENPGSEGLGSWCAMSNQAGNGRPQHFSAWCKEQLGWLQPAVIEPSVKQKLVLSPVEGSTHECFKVLVRPDGLEYFLLENRQKRGFDQSLSAQGLLIWRVVGNRLMLEESHGVEGPIGPRVFLGSVPFPSPANSAFTPFTVPASRPMLAGGSQVHISNIRQLPDGRVTFEVGSEFN